MYAVIETGGKQYRVEVGTELEVELLDVEPGNTITLDRVLLDRRMSLTELGDRVGITLANLSILKTGKAKAAATDDGESGDATGDAADKPAAKKSAPKRATKKDE